jgi:hypothetical protein
VIFNLAWQYGIIFDPDLEVFYDDIQLFHPYERMELGIISKLNPLIKNNVRSYAKLQNGIQLLNREYYGKNKYEINLQNTTYLKNALEFLNFGYTSPKEIKPILFFYSWNFFLAFFKYSLFKWGSSASSHGMSVIINDDLNDLKIKFSRKSTGTFQRLMDCLTVLGIPTICNKWLPIPKRKSLSYMKNDLKNSFSSKDEFLLTDFMKFGILDFEQEINQKYGKLGFNKFDESMRCINEEILSYILVFIASNVARYKPSLWRIVMEGGNELSYNFQKKIEVAYLNYTKGSREKTKGLDISCNFLMNAKNIFELAQNDRWLKDNFIGSFVLQK